MLSRGLKCLMMGRRTDEARMYGFDPLLQKIFISPEIAALL